jgi:tetratricopeptide (TPR) repeat protein/CHAT domain-containing protein
MASDEGEEQIRALNEQVKKLHRQGKYAEGLQLARRICELARSVLGNDHVSTATSLCLLGGLSREMGDLAGAQLCWEAALDIRRRLLGSDHPSTATSLNNLGVVLQDMGNFARARPFFEQSLEIRRRMLGDEHPDTADSLNSFGVLLHQMGDGTGARAYLEQALTIRRRILGDDHPKTINSLSNLGHLFREMGNFASARPYFEQLQEICRRVLGDEHPRTASSLNSLGNLLQQMGDLVGARPYLEQALEIRRRLLGDDHPDTANSLASLGYLAWVTGNLVAARRYYEQALTIRRRVLGDDNPDTARSLRSLGTVLHDMGDLAEARPYKEQALAIYRRVLGNEHPETAHSLNNLGCLLHDMGDLAGARLCMEQALEVRRHVLGDDHPDTATSLKNLGMLLKETGDLAGARPCLVRALEIHRRVLGDDHSDTANSIHNLGTLLEDMGDLAEAKARYEQALKIRCHVLGYDHFSTAITLNNMGLLFQNMGDLAVARSYLEQSLEILRRVLGNDHPCTATSLYNLGMLLQGMGDLVAARLYFEQALEIKRRVLGDDHAETAISLSSLGALDVASGRIAEALTVMRQAVLIDDRMIGQIFSIGTDKQRLLFLQKLQWKQDRFFSLIYRYLSHSPEAVRLAFELVLCRKALSAEALAAQRDAVLGGHYPYLRESFEQLTQLRRRIAQKTLAGPAARQTLAAHEQTLNQWRQQQQQRETELARKIPEVSLEQRLHKADRRAVALGLDEDVALVEFVRFRVYDFHAVPARGERHWQPARYLAFVLPGGQPDQVQMIDLGEARSIDLMIADFRASVAVDPHDPNRDIRRQSPESPLAARGKIGPTLRAAVFDKLVPALDGCKRLLLAPDGDLTRLPFEVLPDAEGHLLLEQYAISHLSCGRDVLRFGAASSGKPTEPLVVADPLFDFTADAGASEPAAAAQSRCSRDFKRSDYHFPRLPGTREEGERVAALLGVQPWLESTALEARLKERRSPRVLHLATHGFFLTDQEHDPNKESRAFEIIGTDTGSIGRLTGQLPENPLLRSGLALAGAQSWLDGKPLPPEAEDGLLTAEDVTGLDLLDTELVVLSACETGLGEVRTGEGVFGLRRAFIVAGARTLVMSLWKVPDEQTRELMIDFYRRVLHGQGVADALRDAQLAMKEKYPDPYYWGAFICQGDPGPLARFQSQTIAADTAGSVPAMEAKEKLASL